jgi:hypothetical protein
MPYLTRERWLAYNESAPTLAVRYSSTIARQWAQHGVAYRCRQSRQHLR